MVITDNTKGKTEVLFDILDLSGKFEDPYVELRCFPALFGDCVELRVQKNNSLACIHMYEIESYAVELECSEGSVVRVSGGKCGCVCVGKCPSNFRFKLSKKVHLTWNTLSKLCTN